MISNGQKKCVYAYNYRLGLHSKLSLITLCRTINKTLKTYHTDRSIDGMELNERIRAGTRKHTYSIPRIVAQQLHRLQI